MSSRKMLVAEMDDASRAYPSGEGTVRALDGVNLGIEAGESLAITGPSGSGKSTLLNLLGCLDRPTGGHVRVQGNDTIELTETELTRLRGTTLGFVFQQPTLVSRRTALENVAMPGVFQRVPPSERRDRARRLLDEVGLADRVDHLPTELSGGERQRVAIARALMNDPEIVLADEPTGNLDTETGEQILAILEDLNARGRTLVMVTHDRSMTDRVDRSVHLVDGRIAEGS